MTGSLLLRGMLIGLLAGFMAFLFAYQYGEPQVDLAIAFEERMSAAEQPAADAAAPAAEEPELVSRSVQSTIGLATGLLTYGAAIGGIFSLVFAFAYGRIGFGSFGARTTSALLALAAFVSVVLVPQIKYPANPPAVGSDDTIVQRTSLFFIILLISIAVMVFSIVLARRLWASKGGWNAVSVAGGVFLLLTIAVNLAMPSIVEMPDGFSPDVIWNFRVTSIGIHLVLWTVVGLGFGMAAERALDERPFGRLAHSR